MKEHRRFILIDNLTKEDKAAIKQNLLHTKSLILSTESPFLFQLLFNYASLYRFIKLLPQIREEKSRFNEYIKYSIAKIANIKVQNFELAGKYRALENDAANRVITNYNLKSFESKEHIIKNGAIRLFIVLLTY